MTREPPADMYSLLAWVESQALEAHTIEQNVGKSRSWCNRKICRYYDKCFVNPRLGEGVCAYTARKDAFNEMANNIRNQRVNQRPHVPRGTV